ncbi:MAG: EamA family transporter [Hyphomicrobium sp.]
MTLQVFLAVLAAAFLHALWNTLVKSRSDPSVAMALLSVGGGLASLPILFANPIPPTEAWPLLAASVAIHIAYFAALGQAYRLGDLTQMYPIARGTAPLLTTAGAALFLGEQISGIGLAGVLALVAGIFLLALNRTGMARTAQNVRGIGFALLTAGTITAYTLVDAAGARIGPSPWPYAGWMLFLQAAAMLIYGLVRWPQLMVSEARASGLPLLAGGALVVVSYALAMWAMAQAPVALVAALRETSVLFVALFGIVFLKEPLVPQRVAAALVMCMGLVLLRLA